MLGHSLNAGPSMLAIVVRGAETLATRPTAGRKPEKASSQARKNCQIAQSQRSELTYVHPSLLQSNDTERRL